MASALLIIDMQNAFIEEYTQTDDVKTACEVINYCSQLMRSAKQPVIHIRDVSEADELNEQELKIISDITVDPSDLHIEKHYSNGFFKTNLKETLQSLNVNFVILCGQAAEQCVVFTYNGANEAGFSATVLQEGVISPKPNRAEMLMQDRNVISHAAIRALVR
ncbi:isochorismatase family cysteine hydrolase [Reinekea marina]|uniref:Cysteine hydrolase family protein n=1 Tax=Reinekea marina TaxID=1310421 RepID=A0ABV7WPW9_9GAMM|nr:isochorismatase family cysteine hydrolase [Reinekea marina]MDN3650743.1 isochorismatase family cysteine hydrolase [Reinekea marina]